MELNEQFKKGATAAYNKVIKLINDIVSASPCNHKDEIMINAKEIIETVECLKEKIED